MKGFSEIIGVYYELSIYGVFSLFIAFKMIQRQRVLGNVKHKIGSEYQIYGLIFPSFVMVGYSYITYSVIRRRGVPYILELVVWGELFLFLFLYCMYFCIKNGEVRENGISVGPNVLKWKEINCFRIRDENVFIIVLNQKSVFTKKYKEVRWIVHKEKVSELRELLNQHVKEICSDSA